MLMVFYDKLYPILIVLVYIFNKQENCEIIISDIFVSTPFKHSICYFSEYLSATYPTPDLT
jgi:hypothetical protein